MCTGRHAAPGQRPKFDDYYDRGQVLGRGAFGVACIATPKNYPNEVAVVKEIRVGPLDEHQRKQAQSEAEVLKTLDHAHIVSFMDAFLDGEVMHIVMEFAEGGDLGRTIRLRRDEAKNFAEPEVLSMFVQIAAALLHIHSRRILHRDLKPANIFSTSEGDLKLGDFGIAKMLESTSLHAVSTVGTPNYLSPEICKNEPYGLKSDIWSLGVVLHELAALVVPFSAGNLPAIALMICTAEPKPLPEEYSEDLGVVIKSLLQKDPEKRTGLADVLRNMYVRQYTSPELAECIDRDIAVLQGTAEDGLVAAARPRAPDRGRRSSDRDGRMPSIGRAASGSDPRNGWSSGGRAQEEAHSSSGSRKMWCWQRGVGNSSSSGSGTVEGDRRSGPYGENNSGVLAPLCNPSQSSHSGRNKASGERERPRQIRGEVWPSSRAGRGARERPDGKVISAAATEASSGTGELALAQDRPLQRSERSIFRARSPPQMELTSSNVRGAVELTSSDAAPVQGPADSGFDSGYGDNGDTWGGQPQEGPEVDVAPKDSQSRSGKRTRRKGGRPPVPGNLQGLEAQESTVALASPTRLPGRFRGLEEPAAPPGAPPASQTLVARSPSPVRPQEALPRTQKECRGPPAPAGAPPGGTAARSPSPVKELPLTRAPRVASEVGSGTLRSGASMRPTDSNLETLRPSGTLRASGSTPALPPLAAPQRTLPRSRSVAPRADGSSGFLQRPTQSTSSDSPGQGPKPTPLPPAPAAASRVVQREDSTSRITAELPPAGPREDRHAGDGYRHSRVDAVSAREGSDAELAPVLHRQQNGAKSGSRGDSTPLQPPPRVAPRPPAAGERGPCLQPPPRQPQAPLTTLATAARGPASTSGAGLMGSDSEGQPLRGHATAPIPVLQSVV